MEVLLSSVCTGGESDRERRSRRREGALAEKRIAGWKPHSLRDREEGSSRGRVGEKGEKGKSKLQNDVFAMKRVD